MPKLHTSLTVSVVVAGLGLAAVACGAASRDRIDDEGPGSPASSGGGASSSSGVLATSGGSSTSGSSGGETCAAQTTSAQRAEVDIVVVIDTSGSMQEETDQVKANINTFASKIGATGLDYTVVMIAEKPKAIPFPFPGFTPPGICVPAPLGGASCADNPPKFHHIDTDVGSKDSLQIVLDQYATYAPWLRPSAYKVFIEVTDDDSAPLTHAQFDAQLLAKSSAQFGDATKRRYIWNSICGWKKGTAVLSGDKCGSAVNNGAVYQNLSKLTGGIVDSVCEADYSGVFDNIAKGLVTKLGCEFSFPKASPTTPADPSKVVVRYTPGGGATRSLTQVTDPSKCGTVPDAWYYDDNTAPTKIVFCPTTCTGAGADTAGKLEVAIGCQAPPPK